MELIDYRTYKLSKKEYFFYGFVIITIIYVLSKLFYDSIIPILFFLPFCKIYFKYISTCLCKRRKRIFCKQFMDSVLTISTSLETGTSFENAIWDAYLQMLVIYSKKSYISNELFALFNQVKVSIPIEEAFLSLAARTNIDDIITFCDILNIAKRTDGNLVSIIRQTTRTMSEKYNIEREIETSLSGKKFEQLAMTLSPIIVIIYLKLSTPDFFEPLYHNFFGYIFVTICLLLYGFSIFLSTKISRIEV